MTAMLVLIISFVVRDSRGIFVGSGIWFWFAWVLLFDARCQGAKQRRDSAPAVLPPAGIACSEQTCSVDNQQFVITMGDATVQ